MVLLRYESVLKGQSSFSLVFLESSVTVVSGVVGNDGGVCSHNR